MPPHGSLPRHETEVLVVGGGPTGMTVAGDLARAGRDVTVLERWPTVNPSSRAFATIPHTLELLDSRGLADQVLAQAHTAQRIDLFAGAAVDLSHLPSRYRFVSIAPQTYVDRALADYAAAQGATVLRGTEASALEQDRDGVTVTARTKDGADAGTWRARYVVGADGAHSTVRGLLGVDFPGETVLSSVALADVRLSAGPAGPGLTLGTTKDGFGFLAPYGSARPGWFRSMTWDRSQSLPDSVPVETAEVSAVLARSMGRDLGVEELSWSSRFHCDERQVPDYRRGRVFLAGDAAHVHSPMGGQGMNTGIQDAVNLAWKLDAVLAGADPAVLDSYQRERHPVGKRVLLQSGLMMRAVTLGPTAARAARDVVAPVVLRFAPTRDTIAGSFSGVTLRYRREKGQHRLVGTHATQVALHEGRLTEIQRERPGFVLVHGGDDGAVPAATDDLTQVHRRDPGPALLVRPDGYIAWAGSSLRDRGPAGWESAYRAWTGA